MSDNPNTPTTNLVPILRARITRSYVGPGKWAEYPDMLCREAADEIERLRAALEEAEGFAASAELAANRGGM